MPFALKPSQDKSCRICGRPSIEGRPFGEFLCQDCSLLIACAHENPDILKAASSYLRLTAPQEKVWGRTECLIATPSFELHRLKIEPHMRCSLHSHQIKINAFYVIDGELYIDTVDDESQRISTVRLLPHEYATVAPGVVHQFRTQGKWCFALEMYYTEPLSEDIIRRNIGGPAWT